MNAAHLLRHRCEIWRHASVAVGEGDWVRRPARVEPSLPCRATTPRAPAAGPGRPAAGRDEPGLVRSFYFAPAPPVREGDVARLTGEAWRLGPPVRQPDGAYLVAAATLLRGWEPPDA